MRRLLATALARQCRLLAYLLFVVAGPVAYAQDGDKSDYELGNPTPHELLREMSTDRPDKTESPYTVDAGRVQLEIDFVSYTTDTDDAAKLRLTTVSLAPINVKLGLDNSTDLQVIVEPYARQTATDRTTGTKQTIDGFGDVIVRLKRNVWGNDGGETALAAMPFVKLPTAGGGLGNGAVEFGIIVPLAISISRQVGIGVMTEVDFLDDSKGTGLSPTFVNTATVGFELTERIGVYTELFTEKSLGHRADWIVTFDAGLTYAVSNDIQLDAGINIGVTAAADDLSLFVGLSRRY